MNSDLSNSELLDETLSEKYSNITDSDRELLAQGSQAFGTLVNQAGNVLVSSQYNRSVDGCTRPLFPENRTNKSNWLVQVILMMIFLGYYNEQNHVITNKNSINNNLSHF